MSRYQSRDIDDTEQKARFLDDGNFICRLIAAAQESAWCSGYFCP